MEKDAEFLDFVVKGLVDHPESVKINRTVDEMGVLLSLDCHPDDMGKIIGKGGKVIRAIRTVMKIPAIKQEKRIYITLAEVPQTEAPAVEAPQE